MAKAKKIKTNDQAIKNLIKALNWEHPILFGLLRERILKIAEITENSIKKDPEGWRNGLVHPDYYLKLGEIIKKELEYDNDL